MLKLRTHRIETWCRCPRKIYCEVIDGVHIDMAIIDGIGKKAGGIRDVVIVGGMHQ